MQQFFNGVPQYFWDDGVTFTFHITDTTGRSFNCGFFHRPFHGSAFGTEYGTVTPPVTWTEFDNLDSWVESIKHSCRNNAPIWVTYDDTINVNYNSWSAVVDAGRGSRRGGTVVDLQFTRCIRWQGDHAPMSDSRR